MNIPPGQPITGVRLPWYMAAYKQSDKSVLIWDGERSTIVPRVRDIPEGVRALEAARTEHFRASTQNAREIA